MRTQAVVVLACVLLPFYNCLKSAPKSAVSAPPVQQSLAADQVEAESPPASSQQADREQEPMAKKMRAAAPATPEAAAPAAPKSGPPAIGQVFVPVNTLARDRYLAYAIDLNYRCDDFLKARKQLIDAIPRFGFILSCETTINEYGSSLSAVFKIKQDSLFSFINSMQSIGYLQHELINGVDHTGEVFLNSLQIKRQKERIGRKSDITYATSVYSRSFDNREEDLTNQEDVLDQKEYEKWQFNDAIAWVEIRIQLTGPQKAYQETARITIPQYKAVFYNIISGLLAFSVALLYLAPYILIIGGMIWFVVFIVRKIQIWRKKADR
jgi:hypothetical protein